MMYQDGSVSKNIRYQEICVEKFREASNNDKLKIQSLVHYLFYGIMVYNMRIHGYLFPK